MNNNYNIKFRLRQLIAVACLLVFIISVFITIFNTDAKTSKGDDIKDTIKDKQEIDPNYEFTLSAGASLEMVNIFLDAMENTEIEEEPEDIEPVSEPIEEIIEESKRENKIYYVNDKGYKYYLDEKYQDYIWKKLKEADHTELYEYVIALIYHESKFTENIVSASNDHGFMQINGSNLTWLRNQLNIESLDNPYDNIDCGIYIICLHYEKYGTIEKALVAYNQGYCRSVTSTEYSRCILQHDIYCLYELEGE